MLITAALPRHPRHIERRFLGNSSLVLYLDLLWGKCLLDIMGLCCLLYVLSAESVAVYINDLDHSCMRV